MSQENLVVVRESVARFSASDMDGLVELFTPDAMSVAPEGWPEGGRFEGRDAVIAEFRRVQEEWGRQSMRVQDERSCGDRVVLKLLWKAQGRASGVPLEMTVIRWDAQVPISACSAGPPG
jgi:ketosteroid isomerase-like protein